MAKRARNLIRQICQAREVVIIRGSRLARSHSYAGVGTRASRALETGEVREMAIEPSLTGGVSALAQALLRPALVGTRILLRDSGCGG